MRATTTRWVGSSISVSPARGAVCTGAARVDTTGPPETGWMVKTPPGWRSRAVSAAIGSSALQVCAVHRHAGPIPTSSALEPAHSEQGTPPVPREFVIKANPANPPAGFIPRAIPRPDPELRGQPFPRWLPSFQFWSTCTGFEGADETSRPALGVRGAGRPSPMTPPGLVEGGSTRPGRISHTKMVPPIRPAMHGRRRSAAAV